MRFETFFSSNFDVNLRLSRARADLLHSQGHLVVSMQTLPEEVRDVVGGGAIDRHNHRIALEAGEWFTITHVGSDHQTFLYKKNLWIKHATSKRNLKVG